MQLELSHIAGGNIKMVCTTILENFLPDFKKLLPRKETMWINVWENSKMPYSSIKWAAIKYYNTWFGKKLRNEHPFYTVQWDCILVIFF